MEGMSRKRKVIYILVAAFVVAVLLRTFVVEGFFVSGDSMSPAIENGSYVLINRLAYLSSEPERGDIVVAVAREFPRKLLKRVIGLPGERFEIRDGKIILREKRSDTGEELVEEYLEEFPVLTNGQTLIVLDPGEYFALGDNREVSIDSRELGVIDKWNIKGRVFGVFNLSKFYYKGF